MKILERFEKKNDGAITRIEIFRNANGQLAREDAVATYGPGREPGTITAGIIPLNSMPDRGGARIIREGFASEEAAEAWLIEAGREWGKSRIARYMGAEYRPTAFRFAPNSRRPIIESIA